MASDGSDQDVRYAPSKLLQMGTVAKYENEFVVLANRVTGISESLLTSFYISGLKLTLQIDLLRASPTTLGEAFALARITEARFEDERATTVIAKPNDLNIAVHVQDIEETTLHTSDKVEAVSTSMVATSEEHGYQDGLHSGSRLTADSSVLTLTLAIFGLWPYTTTIAKANDLNTGVQVQDLELETKVLVDGKQDDVKVVKVVGVAGHQNSDEPNVLKGNGVIGVGVNKNNKGDDKEVQYSVYALHVLIPLLKRLNDKYIKKKKMEAVIQRRLWDPGIKSVFQDNTLRAR
ncbi:hypothetical protein Tco_1353372 [Tanacetum coccineum]